MITPAARRALVEGAIHVEIFRIKQSGDELSSERMAQAVIDALETVRLAEIEAARDRTLQEAAAIAESWRRTAIELGQVTEADMAADISSSILDLVNK